MNDWLSDTMPRYSEADPKGYSPIRWMWDISVNQEPPYEAGTLRRVDVIDPGLIAARNNVGANNPPWTRNMPIIGVARNCSKDAEARNRCAASSRWTAGQRLLPSPM